MHTGKSARRRGIASRILEHIIEETGRRASACWYLEAGALIEFAPALAWYKRYGCNYRNPFARIYGRSKQSIYG